MAVSQRYQTSKRVTIVNAITNTLLAFFKIIAGYFGNSHALLADGIHSLSDLITDAVVLIAAKAGGKMPDKDHPYGHQRIETLAAILIAIILLIVGASIIYEAYLHIRTGGNGAIHGFEIIAAALISMGVKEWLFRYTLAAGKKVHSNLLITNAWHNRSDVWVSALVLISAIGSLFGLGYADGIGAAIIAVIIVVSGLRLFYRGVLELIDTGVDEDTLGNIKECIQSVPGVVSIHQLRTRSHGGNIFVDLHIIVNAFISVSEGHHIGEKIHAKLIQTFPQIADVTVHIDPENDESSKPSLELPARAEIITLLNQYWQHLPGYQQIEKIDIHYLNGQIFLEVCWPLKAIAADQWPQIQQQYMQAAQAMPHLASIKFWSGCA